MNGKQSLFLLVAGLALAAGACQHEPSLSDYNGDFTVYTNYDSQADFAAFETYYLPQQILLIGDASETEYWTGETADQLIAAVAAGLDSGGYVAVDDKTTANLGVQMSYVQQVTYYVGYNDPYWWTNYPYWWSPGYWGGWGGWYYPFYVQYGYTAGSLLLELVDLEAPQTSSDSQLPVVWSAYIGGLLSGSQQFDLQRAIAAIGQAFAQSPYLRRTSAR